jgi:molybdopterin-guanine dinucleotide biosynthesis protein A
MQDVTDISAVILAGGQGSRMGGADKGLINYQQRPLIEWALQALRPQVNEILISANRNLEAYAAYTSRVIPDTLPNFPGPLAGVLAAMDAVNAEWLLVVPCDTPHLPANLVEGLWLAARAADVAIAADTVRMHYTIMLVQTKLAATLRDYLNSGARAVHRWQQAFDPAQALFPDGCFDNLNTPADLIL